MGTDAQERALTKDQVNYLLEAHPALSDADKIKILIVEDDHTTRLLYDKGLFNEVFDKKMAVSGKEALLAYTEWHPDIIVLDIYLPEITGYQVLKTIRTTIEDKNTTIVMATSLNGSEDVESCMKLGVEGYIVKPFQCLDIAVKILGYYAKKAPSRGRNAETLCREIAKQSQIKSLLGLDKPPAREAATAACQGAPDIEAGKSQGAKEAGDAAADQRKA
ncbi:MAG: response regulator transcription factor [Syntrophales bacterium]